MGNSKNVCPAFILNKGSASDDSVFIMQIVQAHRMDGARIGKIRRRGKSGNEEFQERCDERTERRKDERARGGGGRKERGVNEIK